MKFFAHVGDRGGYNALKPVLELALAEGHEVILYLVATSADLHKAGTLPQVNGLDQKKILVSYPATKYVDHDVCLIGASQSEKGSKAAAEFIRSSGKPSIIIEDYYGSSLPTITRLRPRDFSEIHHICVGDEVAQRNIIRHGHFHGISARIEVDSHIHITGLPHFHDLISRIKPRWQEIRTEIRQAFNIKDDHLVFLIAGQLNGTAEAIVTICLALDRLPGKFGYLLIRQHPRATALDKRLTQWVVEGGDRDLGGNYNFIMDDELQELPREYAAQTEMLLPAADFVISGYATTLRYAGICGLVGTISLGTPSFKDDLRREKGLELPPEVLAGVAWYVRDDEELAKTITYILAEGPDGEVQSVKKNQAAMASLNDDQATRRILDLAVSLASQ